MTKQTVFGKKVFAVLLGRPVVIFALIISLAVNGLLWSANLRDTQVASNPNHYPLLAKRIFIEDPNDNIINFAPLRRDLREFFNQQHVNYSFYFEYLPTGTSIKINQDNQMVGASLLKVPLVMNLFRAAEKGEINLADSVVIQEGDIDKRSGTLWERGVGTRLTLREAARYAIVDSDNTAVNLLIGAASGKFDLFQEAIDELDINLSVENDTQTTLSAQGYGSMLKCLYLSCFNEYGDSQQLLEWMAQSQGPPRLQSGLPAQVTVAHKYGTSGGRSESDCGIVYAPKRPYIICVMVDAPPAQANTLTAQVSSKVYDYITAIKINDL